MKFNKTSIKNVSNAILPKGLYDLGFKIYWAIRNYFIYLDIKTIRNLQIEKVDFLRKKETINTVFLAIFDAVWKYQAVYELLTKNPRFNVTIAIIPLVRDGVAQMDTYRQTLNYFKNAEYPIFETYDPKMDVWLDIKTVLRPDVVFFTNPHPLTFDKYFIDHFKDTLTCYAPYCFQVSNLYQLQFNRPFHSKIWRQFYETKIQLEIAKKYCRTKDENIVVTGYPGLDSIYSLGFKPENPWKESKLGKSTKIIWAPHHTIAGQGVGLDWSNFVDYHDYFLNLVETIPTIQIAFKPHPLLKEKLYNDEKWGKHRTDEYYEKWNSLPNGQLEESDYMGLFYFSNGMITDSGSFIVEYLYFDKPILYAKRHDQIFGTFNSFGQDVFNYLYKAHNKKEIEYFIIEVVIKNQDSLKKDRNCFLKEKVLPQNGKTASENIYNELIKELC
jgi:hypothetical protein